MRPAAFLRTRPLSALALLLLVGCARAPLRGPDAELLAAQAGREAALARIDHWRLTGRLAVSGEGEGGSGRIDWEQRGEAYTIELSAPVSRQSWRLSGDASGARLEGHGQGPLEDRDPEALLRRAAGWSMPLEPLQAWVRGARTRGRAEIAFGPDGLPALLQQGGWRIDYRNWGEFDGLSLPVRVFAESGERRVRLVVDRWELGDD
ncbi:lipoprotein insertase outer membrane protein LolB [Aquimonas voraii]|uniref:Outer-membrane lipoprotein LolB n=1 Tax=Aquimonas voraii TaxID=265719 RepID=A0A1G6YDN7_9GAMM|nr:lipoprotein insertase outer membrane protein LolB [Aquimonas voraii]SDD88499.1 outer membrane lipoprotein LolB [Aquimonas voraii]